MKSDNVLRVNLQGDPPSLHPHVGIDLMCRCLQNALYEGLTRVNPQGIAECAACEKVEVSSDQCTYTFSLRDHQWSNGAPVTASHFANAWKAGIAPTSSCLRADLFYAIKNAKKAKKGEVSLDEVGIRVEGDKTVIVELEHPTPYFLELVASPIYAPLYDNNVAPEVFNGPFILQKWERNRVLTLAKNPTYWDADNVRLETFEVSMVKDPQTTLLMYEKGEIDWVGAPFTLLPLDAIPQNAQNPDFHSTELAAPYWFSCNTQSFPLTSVNIRKALSYAVDRKEIADHVLHEETPITTIFPPRLGFEKSAPLEFTNKEKALAYFEAGLKELNLTRETFPTLQFSHSDIPGQKALAEVVAREWMKTLGIKVELIGSEWNVFFSNLLQRQFQISGLIWYFLYNDPIYTLEFFKDKTHRYNAAQWENAEYQKLIALAEKETDKAKRGEYLKQAEAIFLDEMPVIPLYMAHHKFLMRDHVKGIYISDLGLIDLRWSYLEARARI